MSTNTTSLTNLTNSSSLIIRPFSENDSITELTGLLHNAYKFLADMGLHFVATWQGEDITRRHVTNGECFIAELNGKMIGTILLYARFKDDNTLPGWYKRDDVRVFGKFAVDPDFQKQGIGSKLLDFLEVHVLEKGVNELALDTSDKALHLIEYYKKRGYRFICTHQWPVVNYHSVVMSKSL